jgi:hypothetical protein
MNTNSASLTTAGVETDPQGIPGHFVWGAVNPQPPGNSNTNVSFTELEHIILVP